jgi:polysaccharide biosynthesis transport protein
VYDDTPDAVSLSDYARVLWRRKWIILAVTAIGTVLGVGYAAQKATTYQASAEATFSTSDPLILLTGQNTNSGLKLDIPTLSATQAQAADTTAVAQRALSTAGISDMTPQQLLGHSTVTGLTDAPLLRFQVTDPSGDRAKALANAFAAAYVGAQKDTWKPRFDAALATANAQKAAIEKKQGGIGSSAYTAVTQNIRELSSGEATYLGDFERTQTAEKANASRAGTLKYGLLGFGLGLLLGVLLAFFRDAFDTRVRGGEQVSEWLGLPLLSRLHAPPRKLQRRNQLVMLADQRSEDAEGFRILRTALEFANVKTRARTIMFSSALEREGKTTTVANLAVAMALAGKRVVLVDLDLRRPQLARLFRLEGLPGVTDVVLGGVDVDEALVPVPLGDTDAHLGARLQSADGWLKVLPVDALPPEAAEFVESDALADLLAVLRDEADVVLIDAPPLLGLSDAVTLTRHIEALVLIARVGSLSRPTLIELRRLLGTIPSAKLGVILTGVDQASLGYGYGHGAGSLQARSALAPTPPPEPRASRAARSSL